MSRVLLWLKRLGATAAAILLFLYLTVMLIPSGEIQNLISRILAPYGLTMSATSFGKAFPLGIRTSGVTVSSRSGKILTFDRITLKLKILPLLAGRTLITCDAEIGAGTLAAEAEFTRKGHLIVNGNRIRIEDIPFFTTVAGAQARGELRIKGELKGKGATARGELQIEARELDLRGIRISGTPLPDASYRTMQGMLKIADGRTSMESITLQGDGLYARLSGNLPAGGNPATTPLNLKLELMPKPEFLESQKFIFLLLTKYMDTPGHYQLPIRGTLASPSLQ